MSIIGNILWFISGGIIGGLAWSLAGIIWCITVIGIPWGVQCFKFARLSFFPFGKEIRYGGGAGRFILNLIWIVISGLELAIVFAVVGVIFCITIIGIPFGRQYFKFAKLALLPFGASVKS